MTSALSLLLLAAGGYVALVTGRATAAEVRDPAVIIGGTLMAAVLLLAAWIVHL